MLNTLTVGEIPFVVSAKLVKDVQTRRVNALSGLSIIVDIDTNIGLINGIHVQLDSSDFELVGIN